MRTWAGGGWSCWNAPSAMPKKQGAVRHRRHQAGDIGSTASAYAEGWLSGVKIGEETFKTFDADCVTLNGYMGSDSINPFLKAAQGRTSVSSCWSRPPIPAPESSRIWWLGTGWSIR